MNAHSARQSGYDHQIDSNEAFGIMLDARAEEYEAELLETGKLSHDENVNLGECAAEDKEALTELVRELLEGEGSNANTLAAAEKYRDTVKPQIKKFAERAAECDLNKKHMPCGLLLI